MRGISPILSPIIFTLLKVVYIFSWTSNTELCKHSDRAYKMQRLYNLNNGRFVPVAWMCPDCGQMVKD